MTKSDLQKYKIVMYPNFWHIYIYIYIYIHTYIWPLFYIWAPAPEELSARPCSGQLSESLVHPSPLSKNCTYPEWAKGLTKSLCTPHIQHTPSLNGYRLVDATELWAPERPDTETVSSLRQSSHEHLTLNVEYTTLLYNYLFITHTYLHFKFAPNILNCLFCILCFCYFAHYLFCIFVYYYFYYLCLVLSHCVASVTKTKSSYVWTYLALKLILILDRPSFILPWVCK